MENVKKDGGRTLFRRAGPLTGEMLEFQPHVREHIGQLFALFGVDSNGFITLERFVERVVRRPTTDDSEPQPELAHRETSINAAVVPPAASSQHPSGHTESVAWTQPVREQRSYLPAPSPASTAASNMGGGSAWLDAESYVARLAELEKVADAHDSLTGSLYSRGAGQSFNQQQSPPIQSRSTMFAPAPYDAASIVSDFEDDASVPPPFSLSLSLSLSLSVLQQIGAMRFQLPNP